MLRPLKYILLLFFLAATALRPAAQMLAEPSGMIPPEYLTEAAANNPAVQAAFHLYEAALQKIPQAGAYADPVLDIGFFLEPMDIVGGRQAADFRLMQMFPWFGTRKAARTEAQHMAQMTFEQFRETRDNLYLDIYTQWYLLCSLQQQRNNTQEHLALLHQLETLALQKFTAGGNAQPAAASPQGESGRQPSPQAAPAGGGMGGMNMSPSPQAAATGNAGGMGSMGNTMSGMNAASPGMSEVLRIQLETAEAESTLETILSETTAGKTRFNTLLNRPPETEIILPEGFSQIPLLLDTAAIMRTAVAQNPMLGMFAEEALAYTAKAEMDRKMGYPMFGIGLQYMLINKTAAAPQEEGMEMGGMSAAPAATGMDKMNGKDMFMPMLSVTLPIYRNKHKAALRENNLLRRASEAQYADALNRLQAELYQFKHRSDDAARKITLYRKQSALALTTRDLALREFASGRLALSDVIQIQRQLLDYKLKESDATAAYNTVVASIWKMMSNLPVNN
ncbi:Outer membrane efflux protein [Bacteroidales bacterium Barb6XT]|nr:Outer membrane efflux protein [Bacteroidales bacterium Barb6XT]